MTALVSIWFDKLKPYLVSFLYFKAGVLLKMGIFVD